MLRSRILTALALLVLFLGALFFLPVAGWAALMAVAVGLAAWEWGGLARTTGATRLVYSLCAGVSVALFGWTSAGQTPWVAWSLFIAATLFWFVGVPAWFARGRPPLVPSGLLAAGLLVLVPAGAAAVALRSPSPTGLLLVLAAVWIADTAAYFVGRRWGRRKLAPAISPSKTWEGLIGALVAVAGFGALVSAQAEEAVGKDGFWNHPLWITLGLVVLAAVSVVGDLFESAIKRHAGVKDSGTLLPGHGGVLDRVDSLTAALPVAALLVMVTRGMGGA
ncbi:phosphatidate cytidylyltransferase [Pelomicrobium methylotrophicum]|uniref:Phosphatidate cytidylyltransferase n=1 Tax=Pelomicrobium methylotrophicum TaxID=2602750 RepID=A0A5C7EX35_9PROT|nr:phosphatidate cytidylyltransferase [Pelomicrobium methylotrophicum]TXF13669.1 phosphatidate cytidylyltransferase [Pelomicrobium methylotrophicum]